MFQELENLRLKVLDGLKIFDTAPEPAFDDVTRLACRIFDVPIALISLIDGDRHWFKSCMGMTATGRPSDIAFCDLAIRSDTAMVVPDARLDSRFRDNPLVCGEPGIRFHAAAPVVCEGIRLGTVCVMDRVARMDFDGRLVAVLEGLAATVSSLLAMRREAMVNRAMLKLHHEVQAKLDMMEEAAGIGCWHVDLGTDRVTWSRGVYVICGVDPLTHVPDRAANLAMYRPEDRAGVAEIVSHAVATCGEFEFERQICRPDGEVRTIYTRGRASAGADGKADAIFGIVSDLTEQLRDRARLAESEARYRALADAANDLVLKVRLDGTVVYASPSAQRISGYRPEELIGKVWCSLLHPDDGPGVLAAVRALAESGDIRRSEPLEYRFLHPDGRELWFEGKPSLVHDEVTGAARGVVSIIRDVTGAVEARRLAEVAAEAKSQFLATMSHEIRTPLTTILGYADLLKEAAGLPAEAAAYATRIDRAGKSLLGLVNDVLDVSKFEAGQMELAPEATDPTELMRALVDAFAAQAAAKGLHLSLTCDDSLPRQALLDRTRFAQLLNNLIGNACKFTDSGSVRVRASYLTGDKGPGLRVDVADTGCGIDAGQVPHLFHRFFQADGGAPRRHGGTGLGLAICREIVGLMGGHIDVESEPGVGSTFRFEIPLVAVPGAAQLPTGEGRPSLEGMRVLVVDDHAGNRQLIRTVMEAYAVDVVEACGGAEAISACQGQVFDLVFMDIQMPGIDGIKAADAIRRDCPLNAATPVVALTATHGRFGPDAADLFAGIVTKPIDPVIFRNVLVRTADNRRARPA